MFNGLLPTVTEEDESLEEFVAEEVSKQVRLMLHGSYEEDVQAYVHDHFIQHRCCRVCGGAAQRQNAKKCVKHLVQFWRVTQMEHVASPSGNQSTSPEVMSRPPPVQGTTLRDIDRRLMDQIIHQGLQTARNETREARQRNTVNNQRRGSDEGESRLAAETDFNRSQKGKEDEGIGAHSKETSMVHEQSSKFGFNMRGSSRFRIPRAPQLLRIAAFSPFKVSHRSAKIVPDSTET